MVRMMVAQFTCTHTHIHTQHSQCLRSPAALLLTSTTKDQGRGCHWRDCHCIGRYVHTHTHTYTQIYTHTFAYTHTHTHTGATALIDQGYPACGLELGTVIVKIGQDEAEAPYDLVSIYTHIYTYIYIYEEAEM
jgi:hypothetical protein